MDKLRKMSVPWSSGGKKLALLKCLKRSLQSKADPRPPGYEDAAERGGSGQTATAFLDSFVDKSTLEDMGSVGGSHTASICPLCDAYSSVAVDGFKCPTLKESEIQVYHEICQIVLALNKQLQDALLRNDELRQRLTEEGVAVDSIVSADVNDLRSAGFVASKSVPTMFHTTAKAATISEGSYDIGLYDSGVQMMGLAVRTVGMEAMGGAMIGMIPSLSTDAQLRKSESWTDPTTAARDSEDIRIEADTRHRGFSRAKTTGALMTDATESDWTKAATTAAKTGSCNALELVLLNAGKEMADLSTKRITELKKQLKKKKLKPIAETRYSSERRRDIMAMFECYPSLAAERDAAQKKDSLFVADSTTATTPCGSDAEESDEKLIQMFEEQMEKQTEAMEVKNAEVENLQNELDILKIQLMEATTKMSEGIAPSLASMSRESNSLVVDDEKVGHRGVDVTAVGSGRFEEAALSSASDMDMVFSPSVARMASHSAGDDIDSDGGVRTPRRRRGSGSRRRRSSVGSIPSFRPEGLKYKAEGTGLVKIGSGFPTVRQVVSSFESVYQSLHSPLRLALAELFNNDEDDFEIIDDTSATGGHAKDGSSVVAVLQSADDRSCRLLFECLVECYRQCSELKAEIYHNIATSLCLTTIEKRVTAEQTSAFVLAEITPSPKMSPLTPLLDETEDDCADAVSTPLCLAEDVTVAKKPLMSFTRSVSEPVLVDLEPMPVEFERSTSTGMHAGDKQRFRVSLIVPKGHSHKHKRVATPMIEDELLFHKRMDDTDLDKALTDFCVPYFQRWFRRFILYNEQFQGRIEAVHSKCLSELPRVSADTGVDAKLSAQLREYIVRCMNECWAMIIHKPNLTLFSDRFQMVRGSGKQYSYKKTKFTRAAGSDVSAKTVLYCVWPTLRVKKLQHGKPVVITRDS